MTDLTEQWKKGELKKNKYWVKYKNGKIDTWELSEGITIESKPEIIEVLAPVPSYEEWQAKLEENARLKERNDNLNSRDINLCRIANGIRDENFALKELLKECRHIIEIEKDFASCHFEKHILDDLLTKIDNAIGEKKR